MPKTKLDKVKDVAREATDAARQSLKEVAEKAAEVLDPGTASVAAKRKSKGAPKKPAPKAKTSPTKTAAKRSTRAAKASK